MEKIKESDIVDTILVCPYCMSKVFMGKPGCCGESSSHFETAFVLTDGEVVLESETKIVEKE